MEAKELGFPSLPDSNQVKYPCSHQSVSQYLKYPGFDKNLTRFTINHENVSLNKKKQSTDANTMMKTELSDDDFKTAIIKMLQ